MITGGQMTGPCNCRIDFIKIEVRPDFAARYYGTILIPLFLITTEDGNHFSRQGINLLGNFASAAKHTVLDMMPIPWNVPQTSSVMTL